MPQHLQRPKLDTGGQRGYVLQRAFLDIKVSEIVLCHETWLVYSLVRRGGHTMHMYFCLYFVAMTPHVN